MVMSSPLLTVERTRIIKLALMHRWPLIASARGWPERGALMSYGVDISANLRRAASYVERILKGARPAELPIEQPTKLELVVNLQTAKALGLTISSSLRVQADHVIE